MYSQNYEWFEMTENKEQEVSNESLSVARHEVER